MKSFPTSSRRSKHKINYYVDTIYRDKIFVTNQSLTNGNYDINTGEYTSISFDDEYITIWVI